MPDTSFWAVKRMLQDLATCARCGKMRPEMILKERPDEVVAEDRVCRCKVAA